MIGIYIHIPFCKSRCIYCDFFSTTATSQISRYGYALQKEINNYIFFHPHFAKQQAVKTIYFGGGTPSLLGTEDVKKIITTIRNVFSVAADAEITLEANPNDIDEQKLRGWQDAGINRLSIGIQSFNDEELRFIGRRHTASEALQAVSMAQEVGFNNISIDLIYGLPLQNIQSWSSTLQQALQLNVQHISTYCLSYEEGTPLTKKLERGEISRANEDTELEMYRILADTLTRNGYEHYEVSNFALPNYYSRHNFGYWDGTYYIGFGAGAHSYSGDNRSWNINDIEQYISAIESFLPVSKEEWLTQEDKYNEQVMLSLRTKNGIDISKMTEQDRQYCLKNAKRFIQTGHLALNNDRLVATYKGIDILNTITIQLIKPQRSSE